MWARHSARRKTKRENRRVGPINDSKMCGGLYYSCFMMNMILKLAHDMCATPLIGHVHSDVTNFLSPPLLIVTSVIGHVSITSLVGHTMVWFDVMIWSRHYGHVMVTSFFGQMTVTSLFGHVTVTSLSGQVTATSLSGYVTVTSLGGHMKVASLSGGVTVKSLGGHMKVTTKVVT
jgi:hypothetical protein